MSKVSQFELKVPCDLRYTSVVEGFIDLLPLGEAGLDAAEVSYIKSVLNEAFVNVIRHTPEAKQADGVLVRFNLDELSLMIDLTDHGKGICLNELYPPYMDEMVGNSYPLIQTIDGTVMAEVKDKRTACLFFKNTDIDSLERADMMAKAREGGMGISIITKTMDRVEYFYSESNENHLRIFKTFKN